MRVQVLIISLKVTPTRWLEMHKHSIGSWEHIKKALDMRFHADPREVEVKYIGMKAPSLHMDSCIISWMKNNVLEREWVHQFIHTLGVVPKNWYLHAETRRAITIWPYMIQKFQIDFTFEPKIDLSLHKDCDKIFTTLE